jgi:hypothetical protein
MRNLRFVFTLILALILYAVPAGAQQLVVQNEAGKTSVLTRADIAALPHVKVTALLSNAPATFDAVALSVILEKAGIGLGDTLRGKRLASCLLVEAADGYRAVIALPEIDPAFTDKQIVLAYLKDGKPLDEKEGPYRIVIPGEKRMARWVRQVTTLKIVDVQ